MRQYSEKRRNVRGRISVFASGCAGQGNPVPARRVAAVVQGRALFPPVPRSWRKIACFTIGFFSLKGAAPPELPEIALRKQGRFGARPYETIAADEDSALAAFARAKEEVSADLGGKR